MESKRQEKIARLIQKDMGEILQRYGQDMFRGAMVTVTKVYVTGDLSIARVYVSVFGVKDKEKVLESINSNKGELRFKLGRRVRNQLRKVPELEFYIDDSLDYIDNIEQLLKK
ncbi:MAG: 30S ribosome-binding factor RbfA [Bacteroidales bacterium]